MRRRDRSTRAWWVGVWIAAVGLWALAPNVAAGPRPQSPARPASSPSAPNRLLDVPFVAQSEALCGGAAAAMVARYWGEQAIHAEDFSELVDAQEQGIRTATLRDALLQRGWNALSFRGTEQSVRAHLARGRPVIVLVRDSPSRYHYVVVVGWFAATVIVHDPARAPFRAIDVDVFRRAWTAADSWSLLVLPNAPRPAPTPIRSSGSTTPEGAPTCHAAVSSGVALARGGFLTEAETTLLDAAAQCPDASGPWRELSGLRILQGRWTEATNLARRALEHDPGDGHAWRLLATSTFAGDDRSEALRAWNQLGEPAIDLVQVEGLSRTRHAVVESVVDLEPRALLTPARLDRARRRVSLLPTAMSSRVSYRPRAGRAEVDVALSERPLVASDTGYLIRAGVRAATEHTVGLDVASPTGNGERWSASWRWWDARPRVAIALHTPAPASRLGAVWQIEASWERQSYFGGNSTGSVTAQDESLVEETQRRVGLTAKDWSAAGVYWEATAAFDEWSEQGKYVSMGLRVEKHQADERLAAGAAVHGWTGLDGGRPLAQWTLFSAWRSSTAGTGLRWMARGAVEAVTSGAPRALWPGAGVGQARQTFLRAHPLLDDGVISGGRLGRQLSAVTLEIEHGWKQRGPLRLGLVGFADAVRTWGGLSGGTASRTDVDVGVGLRLGVPSQGGRVRVDLARGLRDGAVAASVGWELPWPHWD